MPLILSILELFKNFWPPNDPWVKSRIFEVFIALKAYLRLIIGEVALSWSIARARW
jgi:hypothetical protein